MLRIATLDHNNPHYRTRLPSTVLASIFVRYQKPGKPVLMEIKQPHTEYCSQPLSVRLLNRYKTLLVTQRFDGIETRCFCGPDNSRRRIPPQPKTGIRRRPPTARSVPTSRS